MSLLGMTPTVTATRTVPAVLELAASSNITAASSPTARVATATRPTTTGNSIVIGSNMNYLVLQTLNTASVGLTCYAIGWTYSTAVALWIPKLLTKFTVTCSTTAGAAVSSLRPGVTYVKSLGDVKIYNGEEASCPGGFVVIDVAGSEIVELQMVAASGSANALVGYI